MDAGFYCWLLERRSRFSSGLLFVFGKQLIALHYLRRGDIIQNPTKTHVHTLIYAARTEVQLYKSLQFALTTDKKNSAI